MNSKWQFLFVEVLQLLEQMNDRIRTALFCGPNEIIGEGNDNPLQYSYWGNPMDRRA